MTAHPEDDPPAPYVGLRPFEFHEAALFYGRGEHIAEMVHTLRKDHFLAVVGSSGSGKSSLVRAGLLPAIAAGSMNGGDEAADWRFVIMRPGADAYENLLSELLPQLAPGQSLDPELVEFRRQTLRGGPRGLIETVTDSMLPESARLVVLVDQFEEIFRFLEPGGPNQSDDGSSLADQRNATLAFVDMLLATAAERDPHVYVVMTMRSEYLGECEAFLGLSAAIAKSQFLTPRMTREQVQDIIERPIAAVGGRVEPQVVTDLSNALGTAQDQLPRVEHILLRMWNRACETRKNQPVCLTLDDYRAAGRFESALNQHAEQLYRELGPGPKAGQPSEKQRVAELLFRSLAVRSSQGTLVRRLSSLGEVAAIAGVSEQIVAEVVEHFRQSGCNFLVATPSAPLTGKTTLDISHEALLRQWGRLGNWLKEESKSAETYVDLAKRATNWETKRSEFLRGVDLASALKWQEEQNPTAPWAERYHPGFADAMEFLAQSQKAESAKNRRARTIRLSTGIAVAATCVALAILTGLAVHEKNLAKASEEKIKLRAWAALEKEKVSESRVEALLLAIQAAGELEDNKDKNLQDDLPQVRASLLSAIQAAQWSLLIQAHHGNILSVAFSPDGKTIVSGGDDCTVRSWDLETGKPTGEPLPRHEDSGDCRAAISDGKTIFSVSEDETVRLWEPATGKPIGEPLQENEVLSVAVSPDGKKVVIGGDDGTVRLWDLATGKRIGEPLQGHSGMVLGVDFSPDGKTIVSGGEDGTLRLWELATGKPIGEPLQGHSGSVVSFAISRDGKTIVSGGADKTVRLWELATGKPIGEPLQGHSGMVLAVDISRDGKTIASGSEDGTVRLWDLATGKPIGEPVMGSHSQITSVAISPDATKIACANSDGVLSVWDRETFHSETKLTSTENRQVEDFSSIAISPDGKTIVSGDDDGTVRLWDRETGKPLGKPMEGLLAPISCLAISRNGKTIVSGDDDGTVRLWDAETEKLLGKWMEGNEFVKCLAISPDGKTVVCGGDDGTVRLWDAETGKPMGKPMKEHKGSVNCLAISSDGKTIVSGGADKTVRLWELATGKPIGEPLQEHTGGVDCVAISPDGKTIVSGGADKRIRLWTVNDKRKWVQAKVLKGGKVTSVSFHPKGLFFASCSDDGAVRLWDLHGELFGSQVGGGMGGVSCPAKAVFSDDSKAYDIVAVEPQTRTARLWRIPDPATWLRTACERVRNHDVLVDPRNELAREIGEESGDKAFVKNALIRCMKYGEWSPVEKADLVIRRGRRTADEGAELAGNGNIEGAITDFKEAQKLDPEVDLDPATPEIDKNPQAVVQHLAAPAKVEKGAELAGQGDIEGAITDFKEAQKFDPEVDLDPATPEIDKNPQAVAQHLAASAKVENGAGLAEQGDIEGAIAAFTEAQKLDPEVDLDPATPEIDKNPQAVAQHLAAPAKVEKGAELAGQGDIEGAITDFKEAQKFDPEVDLDPATPEIDKNPQAVAQHLAASAKVENGAELAGQGDIEGAIAAFTEAQKLDPGVDLDPATPEIDKNLQAVAQHLAASAIRQIGGVQLFDRGTCWKSGLIIDVDGAIHAYHPDATSGLDYLPNAGRPGNWYAIVTDDGEPSGNPIIQTSSDPAPGFYVTSTTLQDSTKEAKDPRRYVDSESIPYISVPGKVLRATKATFGDFAVVLNTENQKLSSAIVADLGLPNKLGEGSIALAKALGIDSSPKNRGSDRRVFIYKIFPGSGNGTPRSLEEIKSEGAKLLKKWGGEERLLTTVKPNRQDSNEDQEAQPQE